MRGDDTPSALDGGSPIAPPRRRPALEAKPRHEEKKAPARQARDGFLQIRVSGTPEEMGLQHGELLRDEIHDLLGSLHHHLLYGQPRLAGWGLRQAVRAIARLMEARISAPYRVEMKALARAAGVSYPDVLLLNCVDDTLANLYLLGSLFARLACSAYALWGSRTTDGRLLCGRNLDYFLPSAAGDDPWAATRYMREHVVAMEYAPAGAARFVASSWPGFIGVATAMNDRGVVISSLSVPTAWNWPLATPAPFLYRRVMEQCGSLEEGLGLLRSAPRTQGNNVLLASDAQNTARVVEYTPWRFRVREPEDEWIGATNHFVHPAMAPLQPKTLLFSSGERLARLGELASGPAAGPSRGCEVLLDTALRRPDANEYCALYNPVTIYSTVFAPARASLWLRANDQPGRSFEEISLR